MIITQTKLSKKGNALIYADGSYFISLPVEIFMKSGLKKGSYIDSDIALKLTADSNLHKAKDKALRLLSMRAHSKKELQNKIKRSLDEESAVLASEKMEKLGLIDDEAFSKAYAQELSERKFYGVSRIKYELSQKGVNADVVSKVLQETEFDEESNIMKFLQKKYSNGLEDEKNYRRAVSALQRLGYAWNAVKSAVDRFKNEKCN